MSQQAGEVGAAPIGVPMAINAATLRLTRRARPPAQRGGDWRSPKTDHEKRSRLRTRSHVSMSVTGTRPRDRHGIYKHGRPIKRRA